MGNSFRVGDIVKHDSNWLGSIDWITDVPVNGIVISTGSFGVRQICKVRWSDESTTSILADCLQLDKRAMASTTEHYRAELVAEFAE